MWLIVMLLLALYCYKNRPRDFSVKLAMLPQEALWTVEYSREVAAKAITPEHPNIDDKDAMLALIRQAWQWDKNALIDYAMIQLELFGNPIVEDFIWENRHNIVDQHGRPLRRPDILDLHYRDLILKLADMEYPLAAALVSGRFQWDAGRTGIIHNPLTPENREKLIHYTRYAIKGGFRYHLSLASAILFASGFDYKDSNHTQIHTLQDRIPNLSPKELEDSYLAYKKCALQGSLYAQIKMAEFHYYGISVSQDITQAWAWSLIARDNFLNFIKIRNEDYYKYNSGQAHLNNYNKTVLQPLILSTATDEKIKLGESLAGRINPGFSDVDYRIWEEEMEDVPPMP